jgi:outer membrane receptor protein involved in Fe transport
MRFLVAVLCVFLCFASRIQGQDHGKSRITGNVRSAAGETLPGASVVLKGTAWGTTADIHGDFQLKNIPAGDYTLVVSLLGHETHEQAVHLESSRTLKMTVQLREATVEMQTVEVMGKTIAQEVNAQAYAVTAVDTKSLQNSTLDAKEILNRVSGVRIREEGGLGSNLSFSLNGFSGNQVKFFLDGIPMDNFGSSLNISNIPVNMIERLEVYKGVVPVWLGTDALGGAVNIVTKQQNEFFDVSYSVGSFNTHRVSLNGAYTNRKTGFTVRGNASYNYSDNNYKVWVPIVEDRNIVDTANVKRFHDRYRSGTVQIETGVVDKKYADRLLFGIIASKNDKQVQTGATMRTVYGGIMRTSQSVIPTLKYKKDNLLTEGLNVSLYSAYNSTTYKTIDTLRGVRYNWLGEATVTPGSTDGEVSRTYLTMKDRELTSQFNAGYAINTHHSLSLNYSYFHLRRENSDSENPDKIANRYPQTLTKQVVGLAYKFDFNEKWSTTLFGKYFSLNAGTTKDFDFGLSTQRTEPVEVSNTNLGYGLATSYHLRSQLQFKASYEHTLRLPMASEIFGDGLFILPNPDLGPEQSDNANLGVLYGFRWNGYNRFVIEGNFLYRNAKDMIYQVLTVASPETHYENLSKTRTMGAEGNVKYSWKDKLNLGASVTFQDITDQADFVYNESYTGTGYQPNYQKGYRVPNIPYLFGNVTAGVSFKNVGLAESSLNVNYFFNYSEHYFLSWAELGSKDSRKVIPRQTSHNVEVSYGVKQGRYNIAVECRNLTDARLYDQYYLQKPGRAFYVKLRYAFGR